MPKRVNKKGRSWPLMLIIIGVGLMVYGVVSIIDQQSRASQPTLSVSDVPYPNVKRISLEEAKRAYDAGDALFLDVRPASAYAVEHIPGALNIPLNELPQRLNELDAQRPIITYCT
jgi:3-mercaptopyruvate sulfurtransferase SseA